MKKVAHKTDGHPGQIVRSDGRIALVKWEGLRTALLCYVSDLVAA